MKENVIYSSLVSWYTAHQRPLPWRNTQNPYTIWLSEIILQQTRVDQGLPYFNRFQSQYPEVQDLAKASEDEVLKLWQGLGYYSRARNLHKAAKWIHENNNQFPKDYQGLLRLPGVGDYTAAAIASFAYNERVPVVDGNVFRVLSRLYAIEQAIDKPASRKVFKQAARDIMGDNPALFNQAIMEFGALQCVPKSPNCSACPLHSNCLAYTQNRVAEFPVKSGKTKVQEVYFTYFHIKHGNKTFMQQRDDSGIWKQLYQFPLVESLQPISPQEIQDTLMEWRIPEKAQVQERYQCIHLLSHRKIRASFYTVDIQGDWEPPKNDIFDIDERDIGRLAIPRLIDRYLEEQHVYVSK